MPSHGYSLIRMFFNAVIDKIPWQDLPGLLPAVDVEVGIHIHFLKGLRPVAPVTVNREQQFSPLSVAQREQRLDIIPLRDVVDDPDRLFRPARRR